LKRKLERSQAELVKTRRVIEIRGNVSALFEEMLGSESAPRAPKLSEYRELIDSWLVADRDAPRKQRHTVKRIHDRLWDEACRRGPRAGGDAHDGCRRAASDAPPVPAHAVKR